MTINDFMTRSEAALRWGVNENTLKDRLKTRNTHLIEPLIAEGILKYHKAPNARYGEWILTKTLMERWYGPEPKK